MEKNKKFGMIFLLMIMSIMIIAGVQGAAVWVR